MTRKYNIGDQIIEIHYNVDRFLDEVIEKKEYEPAMRDLVVIDAGANIGAFSFSIYDRVKMIYAIEPSQENCDLMNQTISNNGLEKIKTFCIGLSAEGGERAFQVDSAPGLGGWKIDVQGDRLPTQSIEQFMNENDIKVVDLLKIDIEGAEGEVFRSEAFKNVCSRIHKIVGEFHQYDPKEDLEKLGYLYETYLTSEKSMRFIAKKI